LGFFFGGGGRREIQFRERVYIFWEVKISIKRGVFSFFWEVRISIWERGISFILVKGKFD